MIPAKLSARATLLLLLLSPDKPRRIAALRTHYNKRFPFDILTQRTAYNTMHSLQRLTLVEEHATPNNLHNARAYTLTPTGAVLASNLRRSLRANPTRSRTTTPA